MVQVRQAVDPLCTRNIPSIGQTALCTNSRTSARRSASRWLRLPNSIALRRRAIACKGCSNASPARRSPGTGDTGRGFFPRKLWRSLWKPCARLACRRNDGHPQARCKTRRAGKSIARECERRRVPRPDASAPSARPRRRDDRMCYASAWRPTRIPSIAGPLSVNFRFSEARRNEIRSRRLRSSQTVGSPRWMR
jgi:hypothetical protein